MTIRTRQVGRRPRGACHFRTFTLVELVLSVMVMTILMGSLMSAVLVATRSIDGGNSVAATALRARSAADQLTADLRTALTITERGPRAVTFTVPDRTGDGLPETLRYAWSGVSGDPLTRQYNGGTVATVVTNVQNLDLSYLLQTTGPPPGACCFADHTCQYLMKADCDLIALTVFEGSGSLCSKCPVESAEQVLFSRDYNKSSDVKSFLLKSNAWMGEIFKPALPANALWWKITRVKVKLSRYGLNTGTVYIRVRDVDASGVPLMTAYKGTGSVSASSLPIGSWEWDEFAIPLDRLDISRSYAITVETEASSPAQVAFDEKSKDTTTGWTTWYGAGWTAPDYTKCMQVYVYGTVTTQP
jgi:type II secretory pathway pseudopilin PulG